MEKDLGVIICAAGRSERMQGKNKILMEVEGIPVILRAVSAFDGYFRTKEIVVAVNEEIKNSVQHILSEKKWENKITFCIGGETRQKTVSNALKEISAESKYIAIHDGARAFVSFDLIERTYEAAKIHGTGVPCLSASEATHFEKEGFLVKSIPRTQIMFAQTPQIFLRETIMSAHEKAENEGVEGFDDCSLVILNGGKCASVKGEAENIKITKPGDLMQIPKIKDKQQEKVGENLRIGHGYDAHRLVEGRNLILGGVHIPYNFGLLGHSDADVLTHAIIDAILGAAGKGDIGCHFPDSDSRNEGISSIKLLKYVIEEIEKDGFEVKNIDSVIICQSPKLSPYISDMRFIIADAIKTDATSVNIKATTEEGLGFTGKNEGIAAHAVCLLNRKGELSC